MSLWHFIAALLALAVVGVLALARDTKEQTVRQVIRSRGRR